jgi:uncharacterized protein YdcH (DUF465 family)
MVTEILTALGFAALTFFVMMILVILYRVPKSTSTLQDLKPKIDDIDLLLNKSVKSSKVEGIDIAFNKLVEERQALHLRIERLEHLMTEVYNILTVNKSKLRIKDKK